MRNKFFFKTFLFFFFLLCPFVILASFDLFLGSEYNDIYYAELSHMYNRLKNTDGKKIVIVGNSNVAFGVESRLFEDLINSEEEKYTVVNFGLYGSIGTKAMLDLAINHIKKDDIIILIPEEYPQSMSLYFSAKEMWYALDTNRGMFYDLDSKAKKSLAGNYIEYVSKKYNSRINNNTNRNLGVYSVSSFDSRCDMTNYERNYNIMFNDYDENNPIDLNNLIDDSFISYLNEYNTKVLEKNARMYYSFSPMNKEAVVNSSTEIDSFYNELRTSLSFPIISDINRYIMDKEWFYDSNYHLNTSGMKARTLLLVDDLKNELGITSKNNYPIIPKPVKPDIGIEGEGDNSCSMYFTYELNGSYYKITGLTEEGKKQTKLVIPYMVDGIYVNEFSKDVFYYNKTIEEITIQDNIKRIYDNSFYATEALKKIYLCHDSPSNISIGFNLLVGTYANIYVDEKVRMSFINDYFWGGYQERIYGYEKS